MVAAARLVVAALREPNNLTPRILSVATKVSDDVRSLSLDGGKTPSGCG